MVRVRVRGLVLGALGPWAIWVPGSLCPLGPAFWCESVPWCRKRGRSRVGGVHRLEEVWRKNKKNTSSAEGGLPSPRLLFGELMFFYLLYFRTLNTDWATRGPGDKGTWGQGDQETR